MVFLCSPFFLPPSLATQLGLRWEDSGGGLFDRNILRCYPLSFPKLYASAHTYYLHSLQCWLTDLTGSHLTPCVAKSQVVCVPPIGSMRRFPSICFPRSLRLAISLRSGFRSCGIARPFQMLELSQARAVHPCAMYKNFASARFELAFALFLAVVVR